MAGQLPCPDCNHENDLQARFCVQCGAALGRACGECGSPVQPTHRFCPACGVRLPTTVPDTTEGKKRPVEVTDGQRRQVTVLFGDLTGFTSLSQRLGAEETHGLLNRYFAAVDSVVRHYGGRIDKHIGDGIMAVFGAPVAHSDDPQRAMRAAIDIHAALTEMDPSLTAHVGIASGTVVASDTGSDTHREYTVIGDSVNLAARLQDHAQPGETLVSDAVHHAAGRGFMFEPVGDVRLKGLAEPVSVWRLDGLAQNADYRLPFVGRRAELAQFASALEACMAEGSGRTVLIRGEPGIGKTRLLAECRHLAQEQGFSWHAGLVLDFGAGTGLDAVATIVRTLLGIPQTASEADLTGAVSQAVADGIITADQHVYLNDLLGLPQPTALRSLYDAMDEAGRERGKETLVAALVRNAAAAKPTVITFEDVHWADASTLSHMAELARTCNGCPALLVMTTRIDGDPIGTAWRAAAAEASLTTIDLGPLRLDEALSFASDFFEATERFAKTCVERSGGNPLFLEQLLRAAEEASDGEVPGSVQSIVQARMDSLAAPDRLALQAASVLGQRFSLEALRHLTDNPAYDCEALVEHALVRPEGSGFLFAHALVRDGVYSSLLKPRRTALHGRAAEWFAERDLVLRAEHLDRADDTRAAAAYLAAAEQEAANYRNANALKLSERALDLADGVERHGIVCFRGDLLRALGEVDQSIAAFEEARDFATDDTGRSRAWIGLAEGLRVSDRHEDALDALDNAERLATGGPPLALAEIHHLRGNLYFPAGRVDDCLREHQRALEFARTAGSREWEARALGGLGDASYLAGRMQTACGHFQRCVTLCQELGLGRIEVANRHMVGWSRMYLNEIAAAGEDGRAAAELAARVGHNRAEMLGLLLAGFMDAERRQTDAAREALDRATALARRLGAGHFLAEGLGLIALTCLADGRRDEARHAADEALEVVRGVGMTFFGPMVLGIAARLTDDSSARRALLAEAESILDGGCVSHNYFWFYREAIETALEIDDWPMTERYCDGLERYTATEPLAWSDLFARRGRALARFGRGERNAALAAELDQLATIARQAELNAYIPAIEAARSAF